MQVEKTVGIFPLRFYNSARFQRRWQMIGILMNSLGRNRAAQACDEKAVLAEIGKIQNIIYETAQNLAVPPQQRITSAKVLLLKIGEKYFNLANYLYQKEPLSTVGHQYWDYGMKHLLMGSEQLCDKPDVNYQNFFDISTFYARRVQLCILNGQSLAVDDINRGLNAVNRALQIRQTSKALFYKFLFLQLLEENKLDPPESPIDCLFLYLQTHSDPSSNDYLKYAHLYGGELAKKKRFDEAKKWFLELKGSHPIAYLYLGKIEDQLGNHSGALAHFNHAAELSPDSLEIRIWLVAQKAKNAIHELRATSTLPETPRLQEVVDIFNQFCTTFEDCEAQLEKATSTFIPLKDLAEHFYFTLIPEVANILIHLQQFPFALHLYQNMLEAFDGFVQFKVLNASDKPQLYTSLGVLYSFQDNFEEAEKHLKLAISLDRQCLNAYLNLIAVYARQKSETELDDLWRGLEPLIDSFGQSQNDALSVIFFNLGTAYVLLDKPQLEKAQYFYRISLERDRNNWDTKLYLSRVFTWVGNYSEAEQLLVPYLNRTDGQDLPFDESPLRDFQIYFCLAGLSAFLGNLDQALKGLAKAGQTKHNAEQTNSLQGYLAALKDPKTDKEPVKKEIVESIRRMAFSCRVGKFIDEKSITINPQILLGYHGTADVYASDITSGIKPKNSEKRQFKGEGFYIAEDRNTASYFAMKKVRQEKRGNPILLKVYASQELSGKQVPVKYKIKSSTTNCYDFLKAPIIGFESSAQYYVFESSLKKLKVSEQSEPVSWTEKEYEDFQKKHDYSCSS
jgi:tetratricopeptide (TPR) repeat protein